MRILGGAFASCISILILLLGGSSPRLSKARACAAATQVAPREPSFEKSDSCPSCQRRRFGRVFSANNISSTKRRGVTSGRQFDRSIGPSASDRRFFRINVKKQYQKRDGGCARWRERLAGSLSLLEDSIVSGFENVNAPLNQCFFVCLAAVVRPTVTYQGNSKLALLSGNEIFVD